MGGITRSSSSHCLESETCEGRPAQIKTNTTMKTKTNTTMFLTKPRRTLGMIVAVGSGVFAVKSGYDLWNSPINRLPYRSPAYQTQKNRDDSNRRHAIFGAIGAVVAVQRVRKIKP